MSFKKDHVILVNERDEWVGSMEKIAAHQAGKLHRAFSVFVLNDQNEMLVQQRADGKYHSGGLWSNACCSHPRPGESTLTAAHRRLKQELGFDCELRALFHLRYSLGVGNGLVENEYDHIFIGTYSKPVVPDSEEVKAYNYISLSQLADWMAKEPDSFTGWFKLAMPQFLEKTGILPLAV